MGKDWDKAVPSVDIWRECLRVLKPGAFCFVMSAPRQDVLAQMIVRLTDAGFKTDFTSLYWTYASGFPKAMNIGKAVDKRNGRLVDPSVKKYLNEKRTQLHLSLSDVNEYLGVATNGGGVASSIMGDKNFNELPTVEVYGHLKKLLQLDSRFDELIEREEAEREVVGKMKNPASEIYQSGQLSGDVNLTLPKTDQAKALDGSYGGFQPKPAVEVILVCMKPLSEKTYVDQAMANGKGITWLDDGRIPTTEIETVDHGRFPANLLVSDKVLDDGTITKSRDGGFSGTNPNPMDWGKENKHIPRNAPNDAGGYSRFFSLDKWAERLPFLQVAKASKAEKNEGCEEFEEQPTALNTGKAHNVATLGRETKYQNNHPTVKPIKLMSYLVTLGSRPGDTVLDPFCGSGTTCLAAMNLQRKYVGIELSAEYCAIAEARLAQKPLF